VNTLFSKRRLALCGLLALTLTHCSREPDPSITAKDGSEMLLIKAGTFSMGGMEEDLVNFPRKEYLNYLAERPRHTVSISAFYMDKFEITQAQYTRFLDHIEQTGDRSMDHPEQPDNLDHRQRYINSEMTASQQPVVGINWYDAYAYCNWAGKRHRQKLNGNMRPAGLEIPTGNTPGATRLQTRAGSHEPTYAQHSPPSPMDTDTRHRWAATQTALALSA